VAAPRFGNSDFHLFDHRVANKLASDGRCLDSRRRLEVVRERSHRAEVLRDCGRALIGGAAPCNVDGPSVLVGPETNDHSSIGVHLGRAAMRPGPLLVTARRITPRRCLLWELPNMFAGRDQCDRFNFDGKPQAFRGEIALFFNQQV
jgi:hypothetical protein